jgi:hypothetical protein
MIWDDTRYGQYYTKRVKYQEITIRNQIVKIYSQFFAILVVPGDTHNTWQTLAVFLEGVESSYKY